MSISHINLNFESMENLTDKFLFHPKISVKAFVIITAKHKLQAITPIE